MRKEDAWMRQQLPDVLAFVGSRNGFVSVMPPGNASCVESLDGRHLTVLANRACEKDGLPGRSRGAEKTCGLLDLGVVPYEKGYLLQQELVEKRRSNRLRHDLFLVVEHPAIFTLGRRGGLDNLRVSEEFLHNKGIPVVQIERGGDITFHGPGQLVIYPVVDLRKAGLRVTDYVCLLEKTMVWLALEVGVAATRDSRNRGVWIAGKKLGSVGVAIRHGISFHGLALNVNNDLEPFSWIHPCGLAGVAMTNLSKQCGRVVTVKELKKKLEPVLEKVFTSRFITL